MTVHATGDYLVTASLDRSWAFYDLEAQLCLAQVGRKIWFVEGLMTVFSDIRCSFVGSHGL